MLMNLAVTGVVLAWLLVRQLSVRPLKERSHLALILVVGGLIGAAEFFGNHRPGPAEVVLPLLSLVVGIGLAAVRAYTMRLWRQDGEVLRQGTWVTAVLWLVSIGQHLLVDRLVLAGAGSATLLLYFGVVLGAQRQVLLLRAQKAALVAS